MLRFIMMIFFRILLSPAHYSLLFFSVLPWNFVCHSQIVYICAHWKFDFHFEKWKMQFFSSFNCIWLHSTLTHQYHSIELWNKRLLACCCCCCTTDSSISPFCQLCNIIFTKKYCIKSNEWNKCQSAHTFKKVFLSNPATKHENCTDSTFFLVHLSLFIDSCTIQTRNEKNTHKTEKREENRITIIKFCQSLSYLDACSTHTNTHTDDETTLNTRIWLFFRLTSKYFGMEAVLCVILYRCHCSISLFYRFGALVSETHRDMMYFHISFCDKHPHTIYPYQFTRTK